LRVSGQRPKARGGELAAAGPLWRPGAGGNQPADVRASVGRGPRPPAGRRTPQRLRCQLRPGNRAAPGGPGHFHQARVPGVGERAACALDWARRGTCAPASGAPRQGRGEAGAPAGTQECLRGEGRLPGPDRLGRRAISSYHHCPYSGAGGVTPLETQLTHCGRATNAGRIEYRLILSRPKAWGERQWVACPAGRRGDKPISAVVT